MEVMRDVHGLQNILGHQLGVMYTDYDVQVLENQLFDSTYTYKIWTTKWQLTAPCQSIHRGAYSMADREHKNITFFSMRASHHYLFYFTHALLVERL